MLDQTRSAAERAGLQLSDAELAKLAKDIVRDRDLAVSVRRHVTGVVEPASVFQAGATNGR